MYKEVILVNIKNYLKKLNTVLTKQDKNFLYMLLVFSLIVAIIETVGVSIIMPFIAVASDFSLIESNQYYQNAFNFLNLTSSIDFVIQFGICILLFYFFRAFINSVYIYYVLKFTFTRQKTIMNTLFRNYINIPYKNFITYNSSYLTKNIVNESGYLVELFAATLFLISEFMVFLFIYSILFYVNYNIILAITFFIIIMGYIVIRPISKITKLKGCERAEHQKTFYEVLNKSFNNFKMLKLQNKDNTLKEFNTVSQLFTNAVRINATIQHFPKILFDLVGFSIVIFIVLYLLYTNNTDVSNHYATISIFILGLYRLLPSITRIVQQYHTIIFKYKSLELIYKDYNLTLENNLFDKIKLENKIELNKIFFSYDEKKFSISNLNLTINKGSKIALIGESGSGKSTLADIIMGLHTLKSGNIVIDNVKLTENNIQSWRDIFGYIPQNVYLFDGTIAENIAFGLEIDENRIKEVLVQANIWNILVQKDGLNTMVGESGVMLSGGQKQRIAIARALYKNPEILVLDEATSALDNDTEKKIMDEIYEISKNKTLIIIAHRLSTIEKCNSIYKLENGKIIDEIHR